MVTIMVDDDPTGIQTVRDCLILTDGGEDRIREALKDRTPFFFLLANTRSMTPDRAEETVRKIGAALKNALAKEKKPPLPVMLISRSDSTLRSHFPRELEILEEELGIDPDYRLFVPAFFEGNRVTLDDNHYIRDGLTMVPCAQTEFARDSAFPYGSSYLPRYISDKYAALEKPAPPVASLSLKDIRRHSEGQLARIIASKPRGAYLIINADCYDDLNKTARAVRRLMGDGRVFTAQSAASFVKAFTGSPHAPLLDHRSLYPDQAKKAGLILVGSHVQRTTDQLNAFSAARETDACALDVQTMLDSPVEYLTPVLDRIERALREDRTVLAFTSREELSLSSREERLAAGEGISDFLVEMIARLQVSPGFILAKGGITSHEILARGLKLGTARVLGQIEPGIPVIRLPREHRFGPIPFVIFPGNVGGEDALIRVYDKLAGGKK